MTVFMQTRVIAGSDDDGDLRSLIDGVRSDRPAAIDRLIERVQLRVRRWARRFTDDVDAADDVAQEVLIDLAGRIQRYDGRSKFTTWLFTITRNVALTQQRREQRRAQLIAAHSPESVPPPRADDEQLMRLALAYFDALPPKQRLIFELCDLRGMRPAGRSPWARDGAGDRARAPLQSATRDPRKASRASRARAGGLSVMNCNEARDALLETELPIAGTSGALARHLHECDRCAQAADALARDVALLRAVIRQRTRRRGRRATIAAATMIAAASVVVALIHARYPVVDREPPVNATTRGVVSVEVPAGTMATVLQTKDPNVTVVWLTDEHKGGL